MNNKYKIYELIVLFSFIEAVYEQFNQGESGKQLAIKLNEIDEWWDLYNKTKKKVVV